ncbi:MAG: TIGR02281 family clan AA aspartic protease [Rhizobiaceae bacterium]
MLRKLILLGVFAGSSASIPILYQANPEAFHQLVAEGPSEAPDPAAVAVAPRVAVAMAQPEEQLLGRKVRLAADARGHFMAGFKLNGRQVEALVDTGATLVAINVSTARRIGLALTAADYKYTVETANGQARAAAVTLNSLQIGRIFVENVDAVVLDDAALKTTLVGMSFLGRLDKFQIENGSLLLVQ